jgi:streptogramin lyase
LDYHGGALDISRQTMSAFGTKRTAAFDGQGRIWFTGQTGIYGRLDPATGKMDVWDAPRGVGPYGITATPSGDIYYVSLADSFLGSVSSTGVRARSGVLNPARIVSC